MFDGSTVEELEVIQKMVERVLRERKASAPKRGRGRPRTIDGPKALGINLSQDIYDQLTRLAKIRGVSKAALARQALTQLFVPPGAA